MDSKTTCASNAPSRQKKANSFLVCIRMSVANRSHHWRDTPGRSSSGLPSTAVEERYGHTGVSRKKSHKGVKGISYTCRDPETCHTQKNALLGFKCLTALNVGLN